jgi:hypothetical protein
MIELNVVAELEKVAQGQLTDEQRTQSEQREAALKNPASTIQLIIKENAHLFKDGRFNPGYLSDNLKNFDWFRKRITEEADRIRKTEESLSNDELVKQILSNDRIVTVNMENPEEYQNMPDTNLALLKALGAVPEDTASLKIFIDRLPICTPEDNKYYTEHGEPQRAVKLQDTTHGYEIRHLPTRIDGVFVNGHRLYSRHPREYGQWGFGIDFTNKAVGKILEAQSVAKQPIASPPPR